MRLASTIVALLLVPGFASAQQERAEDLLQQSAGARHGKGKPMGTDPTEKVHRKFNKGKHEKLTKEEKAQLREAVKEGGNWQKEYLDKIAKGDKQALKAFREEMLQRRRARLGGLDQEARDKLKADRKAALQSAKARAAEVYGRNGVLTPEGRQRLRQDLESQRAVILKLAGKGPDGVIGPADRDPAKIRKNAKVFLLKKYHKQQEGEPGPGDGGYEDLQFTAEEETQIWADVASKSVWQDPPPPPPPPPPPTE